MWNKCWQVATSFTPQLALLTYLLIYRTKSLLTRNYLVTRKVLVQNSTTNTTKDLSDHKAFYFYRAAWNATRSYDEISVRPSVRLSVCLSVCLSVKGVHCDKTEKSYV